MSDSFYSADDLRDIDFTTCDALKSISILADDLKIDIECCFLSRNRILAVVLFEDCSEIKIRYFGYPLEIAELLVLSVMDGTGGFRIGDECTGNIHWRFRRAIRRLDPRYIPCE